MNELNPAVKMIDDARKQQNLTVDKLAKLSGVTRNTIWNALRGKNRTYDENIFKMARALQLDARNVLQANNTPESKIVRLLSEAQEGMLDVSDLDELDQTLLQEMAIVLRNQDKYKQQHPR